MSAFLSVVGILCWFLILHDSLKKAKPLHVGLYIAGMSGFFGVYIADVLNKYNIDPGFSAWIFVALAFYGLFLRRREKKKQKAENESEAAVN